MNDFFSSFFQGMYATSYWEWQAIICGILYLYFAIKGKVICWIFGFINAATYVYVCADAKLYLDAILQIFYVLMAIVGYLNWNKKDTLIKNDIGKLSTKKTLILSESFFHKKKNVSTISFFL